MTGCSTSIDTEVQDQDRESAPPAYAKSSDTATCCPLQHGNEEVEDKHEVGNGNLNAPEKEDEDEDADFNPFLKETHYAEVSSSLSSEVQDLDTDADDTGGQPSVVFVKKLKEKHINEDVEHGEDFVVQTTISSEECARSSDKTCTTVTEKESISATEPDSGLLHHKENGSPSPTNASNAADSRNAMMDMIADGAICMRTRARYPLTSFTLDELETFLQETDDEDDLQYVDDEKEYKKFLSVVLNGEDSQNLQDNGNVDDEDEENDADFELELEEALDSDTDEIEVPRITRRNRRQKTSLGRSKNLSEELKKPLRPVLPFVPIGYSTFRENQSTLDSYMPSLCNGSTSGFTPYQIGQLHCLIHEHVQLLIQVFSVCVLDPSKGDIAAETKNLILEMLQKRDQAFKVRVIPYPSFYFFLPYIHPSVPHELTSKVISTSDVREDRRPDEHAGSFRTFQCASWVPYICGPVLSVTDVAPLRLVGNYIDDVSSAVRTYKQSQIELGTETCSEKDPLFPAEFDGQGEVITCSQDSNGVLSSSDEKQKSKKTLAATLIEKSKNQSIALVPKEIAKLAQRFWQLFNPALYPRKPPPAPLANRVLFTDAEDELLALGLMECNNDWKAIQQRFLPCKSSHQIFVRQKNRSSSKAPENTIKAARRLKNSPLSSEEVSRIDVGLKKYKLDWISIWRYFVSYRDPSLLPRQWRIACGTQKSYKSDANKKQFRGLKDSRKKAIKYSASTCHSSPEKEGDNTDNTPLDNTNIEDIPVDKEGEAYVHEAFLADYNNVSLSSPTRLSQKDSQASNKKDKSCSGNSQSQTYVKAQTFLNSLVVKRPYRGHRSKYAKMVKLAPDLPPVNLPPCVRVMPQSAFKKSQVEAPTSRIKDMLAKNGAPPVANNTKSVADRHKRHGEVLIDSCVTEERSDSDFQMHPLLFQAPQIGSLPYYPLDKNNFTFLSEKQPRLNFSLFHNPRQIKDAVNFLSKSTKPSEKHSSSSDIDFHPLLHGNSNPSSPVVSKTPGDGSSGTKIRTCSGKVNELDLDIHLKLNSKNQDVAGTKKSKRKPDSSKKKGSAPESLKLDSSGLSLLTSKNKENVEVIAEIVRDESLPGIIMEQEELSDSDEEFGNNVEFECEEMADSEGDDDTSDSDQLLVIPDEETQLDEMDAETNDRCIINTEKDCEGNNCSTSDSHLEPDGKKVKNNKPANVLSLNLNSYPPVSPLLSSNNATEHHSPGSGDILPRRTRKRGHTSIDDDKNADC